MKKNWTVLIALMLALCMVFTGCSSDEDDRGDRRKDREDRENLVEDVQQEEVPVYESREVWLCVRSSMELWENGNVNVTEYEYDEYGNRIRETNVKSGSYTDYTYDDRGNQIKSQYYGADGVAGIYTEYTYDEEDRLLHSLSIFSDGEPGMEYSYTYDDVGFLVERVETMHYSDTEYCYVVSYNDDHTAAHVDAYQNGEPNGYTEETYDSDGNLLSSRSYRGDGSFSSGVDCAYDEQGRLVVEWKYSGRETQASYDVQYTYDENGLLVYENVDYYYGHGITYEYELVTIQVRVN